VISLAKIGELSPILAMSCLFDCYGGFDSSYAVTGSPDAMMPGRF
jgi:hypothetical protein